MGELISPTFSNAKQYFAAPATALTIVLVTFSIFPIKEFFFPVTMSIIFLYIIIIIYLTLGRSLNLIYAAHINIYWTKFIIFIPLVGIRLISCLAETNRTPFDFAEGESELVSGFNIEYGRVGFALIFMAEYARIIIIRFLFSLLFISNSTNNVILYVSMRRLVFV